MSGAEGSIAQQPWSEVVAAGGPQPDAGGPYPVTCEDVAARLRTWLTEAAPHVTLEQCVRAAAQALEAKCVLSAVRCSQCQDMHLDEGEFATRRHTLHVCHRGHRFRLHVPGTTPTPV